MSYEHLDGGSIRRTDDPGEPTTGVPRISIAQDEIDILTEAARDKIVFEIGTGLGISTRALAQHAQIVVTMDPDPWVRDVIAPTLPANVIHVAKWAHIDDALPDTEFTMAFIDGDHSTKSTHGDISLCWGICDYGARIYVHDAKYPNVSAAFAQQGVWSYTDAIWKHIPTTHGLAYITVTPA